ncbi:dsDNA nuclease domain-containing protein [Flavobacterium eburneipallidum]|uniref:dsDNA nuclease domain-containing protein n=1 Tax=Flavobacterium eburneipallidum TaxID=3003263 RepID=UPI0024831FE9|nr:dsDNA nuclease domain-containing protein [Flavobacterium eburneipallidum]
MELNKLFLFSKNTDAFAAQRGYNYQTLKTLETWISNFISNTKEDIYCEFEEDIFQKDLLSQKLTFRQIKLYSSNFSFSSEEVKKCISHFFTLHVKSNYNDFSKEYVFETNTNIAQKYLNNDADMLKEWFEYQNQLDEEKLKKYAQKVKEIVTEYIEEQKKALKDNDELQEAVKVYDELDKSFWQEFTKMIKWKFIGTSPDDEFTTTRANIELLIQKLPHNLADNNSIQVFGVLLDTVFMVINEKLGEERKLTYDQLEQRLFSIGNEDDKWYSSRYDYYKKIEPLSEFRIGEFYEILDLVNYCRRKKYLHTHKILWNPFLIYYAKNLKVDSLFRKKAVYEIVFLNNEFYEVDYENLAIRERPEGNLFGFEEDIRYYFSDFVAFKDAKDIENAHNIINVVFVASKNGKASIEEGELRKWFIQLYRKINQKLLIEKDISEKCNLLELQGNFLLGINRLRNKSNLEFIEYFDEILALVEKAPLFKLSQFGDRIEKYIKMHLNVDPTDKMGIISALEDFSENLFPLVEKREGKVKLAQSQVKRGYNYLKTNIPKNLLKALEYFHSAKDNYLQEDTIEGFVLALLNIAQLYNSIGMHFAAKNYALAAFRMSTNKELIKRVENSLSLLAYADYLQGSWFNSLSLYGRYIGLKLNANFDKSDAEEEQKATLNIAFMLYVMRRSSNQFKYLNENYIVFLDYIGSQIVVPILAKLNDELQSDEKYNKSIENQINDFPFNDFGKTRIINFYALGSLWCISFDNTHEVRSIAEEYISSIQVVLAEIALSDVDFHLLKSKIDIELTLSNKYVAPEQLPSNEVIKWKVYICFSNVVNTEKINQHSAFNMVSLRLMLDNISLLKSDEFDLLFWKFFKEAKLDTKQIAINLYQKIHRDIYLKEDFEVFQASSFEKENFNLNFPRENKVVVWDNSLSQKYNKKFSLEAIENRFNNMQKCTYLTLAELKKLPCFPIWLNDLRSEGHKDWQILMNMQNFMINYKVRRFEKKKFNTEEKQIEHFQKTFYKYMNMDEKDCYVEFPLEAFKSKEFTDQFNFSLPSALNTYGLETKLMTPNFTAIKEFLDIRFNLRHDDYNENNPLNDIY